MNTFYSLQGPASDRIPCDFPGCCQDFTRLQDMQRHKIEYHETPKKCPWCRYTTRRDLRLFKHMEEHPKYQRYKLKGQRLRSTRPSTNPSKFNQEIEAEFPSRPKAGPSQKPATLEISGSELDACLGIPMKRALSQQVNLENLPIFNSPRSSSEFSKARADSTNFKDELADRTNISFRMEASGDAPEMQAIKVPPREELFKSTQSGSKEPALNSSSGTLRDNMTSMQSSQNSQGLQSNGLWVHQFSQPQIRFEPTPLSFHSCMSLPFVPEAQMSSYLPRTPASNHISVPQINSNSYHPYQSSQTTSSSSYSPYPQLATHPEAGPRISSSFEEKQISPFLTYQDTPQSYD